MKTTLLLCCAFLATAVLAIVPSCKDKESQSPGAETAATEPQVAPQPAQPAPTAGELLTLLAAQFGEDGMVSPSSVSVDASTVAPDGSLSMTVGVTASLKEDRFAREDAPAAFNSERKASNECLNRAVLPDSVYLMQVGAPTDMLTDADRAAKPLPEDLRAQADALKALAEAPVYRQLASAGQEYSLVATCTFSPKPEGGWDSTSVELDAAALAPLEDSVARTALPEGAAIASPEFEEARKAELREKISAFIQAAEPFIRSREDEARKRLAEQRAQQEEELRRAAEQAEAEAKARQEWEERCARFIAEERKFSGEWTRDNRFGELTLQITRTTRHDNAIHFIGSLYDTKLPAASLDIAGRCDLSQSSDKAQVDVTIYDGQYDPDQPTAELYDADDSLMVLKLSADGKLEGVMSCQSWKDSPEKAFNVTLSAQKPRKGRN